MSEFQLHAEPGVSAVEGKFDPKALEGRNILSSDWMHSDIPLVNFEDEVIIEGEELPAGTKAKVTSVGATACLSKDEKSPMRTFKDMFMVMATNTAGESVPFGKLGDGGKIVINRKGEVVGIICGGGQDPSGKHQTVLVPAEQFNVGMPA